MCACVRARVLRVCVCVSSQVKSSQVKFYCQFFHMYSTYIQRIKIALLSDPWCIQLTLNTDSRCSNTDKYSLTICTYKLYRYTNEDNCRTIKKIKRDSDIRHMADRVQTS